RLPVLHTIYRRSVAVIDRHAQSELRSDCQRPRQAERSDRQFYFVNSFFVYRVAFNDRFSWTITRRIPARTGLVANHNRVSQIRIGAKLPLSLFVAAQRAIV